LRTMKYALENTKKTTSFIINVEDRFGKQKIKLGTIKGWRREFAQKLPYNPNKWDDNTIKAYVSIQAIKTAKNKEEALHFLKTIETLNKVELYFWTIKFLNNTKLTKKAWRVFYAKNTH